MKNSMILITGLTLLMMPMAAQADVGDRIENQLGFFLPSLTIGESTGERREK